MITLPPVKGSSMTYTGVGSRQASNRILDFMGHMAWILTRLNYTLRSGGADGCDKAFDVVGVVEDINSYDYCDDWASRTLRMAFR